MTLCSTKHTSLVLTVYLLLLSAPLGADSADQRTLQEPPSYGIYYEGNDKFKFFKPLVTK